MLPEPTYSFRCERCAYDLTGLPREHACPECGLPVRESMAEAHPGTPWQQSPGLGTYVRTAWMSVRRPRALYRMMRTNRSEGAFIGFSLCSAAILFPLLHIVPVLIFSIANFGLLLEQAVAFPVVYLTTGIVWLAAAAIGTWVIMTAVRVARLLGLINAPRHAVHSVLALSTCAWAAAGLFCLPASVITTIAGVLLIRVPGSESPLLIGQAGVAFMILAYLFGFVHHMTLAILGIRRLRYRNHPAMVV